MEHFVGHWNNLFSIGFKAGGAFILIAALVAINRIICRLSKGNVRRNWSIGGILLGLLSIFYISSAIANWMTGLTDAQKIIGFYLVPMVFFLCAGIVYLIINFLLNLDVYFTPSPVAQFEDIIDSMMGIYNRRYLDSRLNQEIHRSQRYNLPLSLALLSLDNIRQISETYGKRTRDQLLCNFAKLALNNVRITDITARYGEAEIMVVATNTPVSSMSVFAERMQKAIAETLHIPEESSQTSSKGEKRVEINVCIGISGFSPETKTKESLVKSVENALSQARSLGPNKVIINKPGL
ncbi:MAG: GGDEF domain-containing protein [Chitinispirillaceae bacterium]|jgi:diguanylate cyclase (GGDEF)-like protein